MDETDELVRLSVRALAAQMIDAPGVELHQTRDAILGLTDVPLADFNRLILGAEPVAAGFLTRAVARARERGSPVAAVMTPAISGTTAPLAAKLGLVQAGAAPLMVLDLSTPVTAGARPRIVRALGDIPVVQSGDLIAAAFDTPRDLIARCIEVCMTPTSGVETWLSFDGDEPVCTVSVTLTGDVGAMSLMATHPDRQGRGHGRALLGHIIADYRARGVTRFHLGATAAGLPLYRALGFRPVADLPVWLLDL